MNDGTTEAGVFVYLKLCEGAFPKLSRQVLVRYLLDLQICVRQQVGTL